MLENNDDHDDDIDDELVSCKNNIILYFYQ